MAVEGELDALYGLPAAEFTAARDALARRLREEGRRDEAGRVKGLRRPSAAAAALNRAVRRHPEALEELLAAGRTLERAQERLLAGRGDRAVLREAAEHVREATAALAGIAAGLEGLSPALRERVRATLQAAVVDPEVRDRVRSGRLEREAEAPGGLFAAGGPGSAGASEGSRERRAVERRRRAEAQRQARAEAEARLAAASAAVAEAEAELAAAEAEAELAALRVETARTEVRRLKADAAAAQAAVDEAG